MIECRPGRWIWGLVPLAFVWLVTVAITFGQIERDLSRQALERLAAAGQGWAEISADGRSLSLRGAAPDGASRAAALGALRTIPGVRSVTDISTLRPPERPRRPARPRRDDAPPAAAGVAPPADAADEIPRSAQVPPPGGPAERNQD